MGASYAKDLIRVKILRNVDWYFEVRAGVGDHVDVFAWSPYEVPEVDPEFIVHKLNVDPSFPPKKQKPRRSTKEHVEAVR